MHREFMEQFLKIYESEPCLWFVKGKDYYNRTKKDAAYDRLIRKLKEVEPKATKDSVIKKINNIRSVYRKEVKKVKASIKSGAAPDELYKPRLWYFNHLNFLGQLRSPSSDSDDDDDDEDEDVEENLCSVTEVRIPTPVSTSAYTQVSSPIPTIKKRKIEPIEPAPLTPPAPPLQETEDNEFQILAKAYAFKLRKLTPQQLMFTDKAINDILLDGQMGLLTRHSYMVHPSGIAPTASPPPWGNLIPPPNSSSGPASVNGEGVVANIDNFTVKLDTKDFGPEEITVKVITEFDDNVLCIEAKHEERGDNGYVFSHIVRKYTIPDEFDAKKVTVKLSSSGQLAVTVPQVNIHEDRSEIIIPINRE